MRIPAACLLFITFATSAHARLHEQVAAIAARAHGRVGVACSLPGAVLDCALDADARLPMQSMYKLQIAMAALHQVEAGRWQLTTMVPFLPSDLFPFETHSPLQDQYPRAGVDVPLERLMQLAVSDSDNAACDLLLRLLGGPSAVDAYVKRLGIRDMQIANTEKQMHADVSAQYRNYASARAMVALLRMLADRPPLSAEHTALLLKWMTDTSTGEHRLKSLLPPGTVIAHKTGTSGVDGGLAHATNDAGLITIKDGRKLAIAVLVSDSRAPEAVRERVIAEIARAVWQAAEDASGLPATRR